MTLWTPAAAAQTPPAASAVEAHYRTARLDGVEIAYREAGPPDAPAVLLLHGFPTSSRMFRNLIPALSGRYHLIALDYPGRAGARRPTARQFRYGFASIYAKLVEGLADHP